jgi:ATP-dependent DNA ligase
MTDRPNTDNPLPKFIPPQLALLRKEAPSGGQWVHEIKLDGYRIHARNDRGRVQLLTRNDLNWTERYRATEQAPKRLPVGRAYLDGELCAVRPDGTTSFAAMQVATDSRHSGELMFFLFDLLHLDGADMRPQPLLERKVRQSVMPRTSESAHWAMSSSDRSRLNASPTQNR